MKPDEQELLARTGAGTPMGELYRRFWIPALLGREVEADGAPVRVRLLSEDLIAFRDTSGRVGLLHEHCCHRGASLYFGKNADNGLSCWYHGWKYDVTGKCLDQPNEPPHARFCDKVRQPAYPCVERNGVVWTYMGPAEKQPPLPELEWLSVAPENIYVSKRLQECHFMQGLEGDIDSSHLNFLHSATTAIAMQSNKKASQRWTATDTQPRFEVAHRSAGFLQASRRNTDDETNYYWRIGAWLMPFFTLLPAVAGDSPIGGHAWVPRDDDTTWTFAFQWHPLRALTQSERQEYHDGTLMGYHSTMIPGTWTPLRNKSNDYVHPDAPSRTGQHWERILYFQDQDVAITESIGARYPRTLENLGSTDIVIVHMRRRLMDAARALAAGKEPEIDPASYRIRAHCCVLPRDTRNWAEAVAERMDARPGNFYPSV